MMTWPHGPAPTSEGINWREARYLARVVQMLVTSSNDRAEFRRELEHLLRAAEALRADRLPARSTRARVRASSRELRIDSTDERAAEGAVLTLWRTNPSAVRRRAEEASAVADLGEWRGDEGDVDEVELARAVEEIERAAAVLRAQESAPTAARRAAVRRYRPPPLKQQFVEFWIPLTAATVGILAALLSFMR